VLLGQIGEIKTHSTAVMHVRVYSGRLSPNVKWRGAALSDFDGKRWFNTPEAGVRLDVGKDGRVMLVDDSRRRRPGNRAWYRVDLRDLDTDTLFFAGEPEVLNVTAASVTRTSNDNYRIGVGALGGLQYGAHSYLQESSIADIDPGDGAGIPDW